MHQRLAQPIEIAVDALGRARQHRHRHRVGPFATQRAADRVGERRHPERLALQVELAILHLAVVEQARQHLQHRLPGLLRLVDQPMLPLGEVALAEQRQRPEDAVQRVAHLVAHHRQEARLGAGRQLGLLGAPPADLGELTLPPALAQDQEQRQDADQHRREADHRGRAGARLDARPHQRPGGAVGPHHPKRVLPQVELVLGEPVLDRAHRRRVVGGDLLHLRVDLLHVVGDGRDRAMLGIVHFQPGAGAAMAHHEDPAPQDVEALEHLLDRFRRGIVAQRRQRQAQAQQLDLHLRGGPLRVVLADHPQVLDILADGVEPDGGEARHRQENDEPQVAGHGPRGFHCASMRTTCQIRRRR